MELGESLLQAAHREVMEEANLALQQVESFGLSSDPMVERHAYPNGDVVQNVSLLVHAKLLSGNPASNDGEATEFRFCLPSEIDEASFVTTEFATFMHWQNYKRSGQFQIV